MNKTMELNKSYRSAPEILKFIDDIFCDKDVYESISLLQKSIKHIPHRKDSKGLVELWPIVNKESDINDLNKINFTDKENNSKEEKLSIMIVEKIKDITEKNQAKYGDIAIIFRSRKNVLFRLSISPNDL